MKIKSPSPLAGEVARQGRTGGSFEQSPPPYPPPQGGRGQ
jgi:hypothetical protein